MSAHRYIDRICAVIVILAVLLTVVFMNGEAFGIESLGNYMGYEN